MNFPVVLLALGIAKKRLEAEVHVLLIVTAKKCQSGLAGR
jgi:hypothetical protein